MNYEAINQNHYDTFSKLKYGFENKIKELEKFMWKNKKKKIKNQTIYSFGDKKQLDKLKIDNLETYTKSLIPNSFALQIEFTLKAPYYSSDEDDFYIINNPCLKEKVFKVPMVRGSSWKGVLLNSARDIINSEKNSGNKIDKIKSYFRIFGVGNEEFRKIVDNIDDNSLKIFFMLNGLAIDVNSNTKDIFEKYKKNKAQKGRAVFYPTYFDKLSLELINPHNRKTKAGTNPIHYEVVPKGTKGELQIVYIPFDNLSISKKEAKDDLDFLKQCIKIALEDNGIGAKTKLGWGRAEDIKIREFWSNR